MALVPDVNNIRLGLAGKLPDNDHPYSWSAIINGYDAALLPHCPNAIIRDYLSKQPRDAFGIPGVRVTHIWCEDFADAQRVAAMALIPHVAARPEQLIGQVDAVLIPTDRGDEHVERARPFIQSGVPIFVDKPLVDNNPDLQTFRGWKQAGAAVMSSSAMRYAVEFRGLRDRLAHVGRPRFITMTMARSWERYGIHALEAVYPFLVPGGWVDARMISAEELPLCWR
jgi:predicted dehydrogenase